jgi:hypothetical protein
MPALFNLTLALIILMVAINVRRCADDERKRGIKERKTENNECKLEIKERSRALIIRASEFLILKPYSTESKPSLNQKWES